MKIVLLRGESEEKVYKKSVKINKYLRNRLIYLMCSFSIRKYKWNRREGSVFISLIYLVEKKKGDGRYIVIFLKAKILLTDKTIIKLF